MSAALDRAVVERLARRGFLVWSWQSVVESHWLRRLGLSGGIAAASLIGALQTVRGWRYLNPDGVSYLDLGAKLLQSKLTEGYSGYWSPLYAILGAAGAQAADLTGRHRLAGVHALNLAVFLAALAACVWMVRKLAESCGCNSESWPAVGLQVAGLSLFTAVVVKSRGLQLVTPDMLVAGLTMAVVGMTAKITAGAWNRRNLLVLGVLFGIGYWAKAIFFPLWWWWLTLAIWMGWGKPGRIKALAWALAGWLMLAAPLVAMTSRTVGRLSFGEVGRLNVLWYVNGVSPFAFWEGREDGYGQPVHPLKKLGADPTVYFFGVPPPISWTVF